MTRLLSDEDLLDVSNPSVQSSHAYDNQKNGIWSVISAGMYAYLVFTDLKTNTVGPRLQLNANMKLDPGDPSKYPAEETDFSPETFINALVIDLEDGKGNQLLLELESLDNVGFDLLSFVNTTTGVFSGPVYNLMDDSLVLDCQSYNCDKSIVSTYDPVGKVVYFEAHVDDGTSNTGNIAIGGLFFTTGHVTGEDSWYVSIVDGDADFGYNGFQYYNF